MDEKLDPKFVLRLVNAVFNAIDERYPDNTAPAIAASTAVYAGINILRLIYNMSNANKEILKRLYIEIFTNIDSGNLDMRLEDFLAREKKNEVKNERK